MAIQCGICRNVMSSASFLSHKDRKHPNEHSVPFVKLPDSILKSADNIGDLVKCRHCPNRIPRSAMEGHMQRCHIECHICKKMLTKSNRDKHMQQKHGSQLVATSSLSQSKSSLQSDDMTSAMDLLSIRDPSPVPYRPPPMPAPSEARISPPRTKSDLIRVNEWELHNYIREGRVYTKNGFLYLRNRNVF